ncbi:rho guanine nucleotide exchange factor 25 isoform X1 [Rana temporaria]|uniref:rho guanine nucleotide exchange factor 25 isoform X1 n=1 Tax=Rana temporaria TaxID=8407 RepID=UPI001AACBE85|nr:rho guanine nucleotide exchange factor 25 isoform X1 [Rana temporaria]
MYNMKTPQRHVARTDQMLGAMADILGSLVLPSHPWISEACSEDSAAPEQSSNEESVEEPETTDVEEEHSMELSDTAASQLTPPENTCPGIGRTRRLSDFRAWFAENFRHCSESEEESYSIAGSDGSISASVASIQPQPSTSSAPSSPGSRRSVSTLKKWLTNPVRKLSSGSRLDQRQKKIESRPKRGLPGRRRSADDGGRGSFDLGVLRNMEDFTRPEDKSLEWKEHDIPEKHQLPDISFLCDLLQGASTEPDNKDPHTPYLPDSRKKESITSETSVVSSYSPEETEEERKSALEKSMYVLMELVETEKMYVEDLGQIVEGYMATMSTQGVPEDMKGKDKIVFGNIHQIFDWHKDYFLGEIQKCLEDPSRLAQLFIKHERRLHMYVVYCQNKPKSEHIVSEYIDTYFEELRQQLSHRLQLNDLLIKPVQRIMKYQLLLKDFLKYYSKAGQDTTELEKAVEVMCFVPKRCNDMMNLGRLQGFEGKITAQGKLLQQDTFMVMEQECTFLTRGKERRVFLFEQLVIFSEPIDRKKGFSLPGYIFKNSIKISCLGIEESVDSDPCKFALTSRGTDRSLVRYILQAPTAEIRLSWIHDIGQILDSQRNFLNALQSPIEYQRRESKSNSLGRSTNSHTIESTRGGLRPHSSASMDRNKLPNLKSYNTSLPSLFLPSNSRESRNKVHPPRKSSHSDVLPPATLTPAHINLNLNHYPESSTSTVSNGTPQSDPTSRKLSTLGRELPGYSSIADEMGVPVPRLAKLDEDEL